MKSPTQRKIAALKPLEKRYSVALGYGLSLKVQPSGAKSFVLRLCVSGRVTDILLGHFPEMSLGEAKQAARRRRKEIGKEPPKGYVFADAFRLWCNLKKGRKLLSLRLLPKTQYMEDLTMSTSRQPTP